MRASAWLTLIVSFAVAAGLSAFLLATPDQGNRVARSELGFAGLSNREVDAALQRAADHHIGRFRVATTSRSVTANTRAWLTALAGSRVPARDAEMPRTVRVAAVAAPARARVAAFVRFADDLPTSAWTVTPRATAASPPGAGVDAFTVSSWVDVSVAQATGPRRRQRIPVTVRLVGVGGTPDAAPRGWRVRDVVAGGPRTFVRAYADPIIVHRTSIDVVAPAAERVSATRLADAGQAALVELRERYPGMGAPAAVTAWMLEDGDAATAVLGAPAPSSTTIAGRGTPHGASWLTPAGDVALDLARTDQLGAASRGTSLRRELVLVALRGLSGHAPAVLLEGLAAREVRRVAPAVEEDDAATQFSVLVAAFRRGDGRVAELLAAPPTEPLAAPDLTSAQRRNAYLAAEATVGWIEREHGHPALLRLLAQLREDVPTSRAVRNVLRVDLDTIERGAARWSVAVVRPPPVPTAPDAGRGEETAVTGTPSEGSTT